MKKFSSKYILQTIKSFIKDDSFIYKLINYSKCLQAKFEKNKTFYQEKFLENRIDFRKYLIDFDLPENKSKLKNILLEYQINEENFSKIALLYFEKYFNIINNKYVNHDLLDISLNSPYFDVISESKILKNFNIKLKDLEFDKLKQINHKYTSISLHCNDLNNLKNSAIDFNVIQALKLKVLKNPEKLENFFNGTFSFNNQNKLLYLNLELNEYGININTLDSINDFKSLEYLTLSNFIFDNFELKLNNLKLLSLNHCRNIMFKEKEFLKLKYLTLNYCTLKNNSPSLLKCPFVESCELFSITDATKDYNLIFDLSNFNQLKEFKGNSRYFILLEKALLEKAILELDFSGDEKYFKKFINKLLSMNTLKEIEVSNMMSNNLKYISEYDGDNNSITKFKLTIINNNNIDKDYKCLQNIQDKFLNLSEFILNIKYAKTDKLKIFNNSSSHISINNNDNCKIYDIVLCLQNIQDDINIYCGNYEKLKSIYLSIWKENSILEVSFPIFYKLNNVIFNSLVSFHFESDEKCILHTKTNYLLFDYDCDDEKLKNDFDILENIKNNFDKMPNLKQFYFSFGYSELINKRQLFLEAVKKVLSLKCIKSIYFSIYKINEKPLENNFYSISKLKELFPDIEFNNFYEVKVSKSV